MTSNGGLASVVERSSAFDPAEAGGGDGRTFEGYCCVFNSPTTIESYEGRFTEVIQRGAFTATLNERMPVLQYNHGTDPRIGTVPLGRIEELREDDHGLFVSARLYPNDVVEPVRQAIEGGSITGASFRFKIRAQSWSDDNGRSVPLDGVSDRLYRGDQLTRHVSNVALYELGPVLLPAYPTTSVGVRSATGNHSHGQRAAYLRLLQLRAMTR